MSCGAIVSDAFDFLHASTFAVFCCNQSNSNKLFAEKLKQSTEFESLVKLIENRKETNRLKFTDFSAKVGTFLYLIAY